VLAIDYRGYGGSTGSPKEAGITLDARAAYDWIRREAPQSKIAVFGAIILVAASPDGFAVLVVAVTADPT
jgi:alpha/beta superfamily hydrolase